MKKPARKKKKSGYDLARSPIDVALELKDELELFTKIFDRTALITAFRDQFILTRLDSAKVVEKNRLAGLNILFERMATMSDNMLIKTIQSLSEMGHADLESFTGATRAGTIPIISVQQNLGMLGQSRANLEGNPIKDAGQLLESLEHIATYFRTQSPPIIELQAEEEKK
jgi:hypothetical protein